MRNAFQRQLAALGWRAAGFAGAAFVVLVGAFLWGSGIESRVSRAERDHHRDHRLIVRLAQGKPLHPHHRDIKISSKEVQNLEQQAGEEVATEAPNHGEHHAGQQEVRGHEPKAPHPQHSKLPSAPKQKPTKSTPPAPVAFESTTSSSPPLEEAGNSGETPAAENSDGLKACVNVAVSACLNAGLTEAP